MFSILQNLTINELGEKKGPTVTGTNYDGSKENVHAFAFPL